MIAVQSFKQNMTLLLQPGCVIHSFFLRASAKLNLQFLIIKYINIYCFYIEYFAYLVGPIR